MGYQHSIKLLDEIKQLRNSFESGALSPVIAQVPNTPPLVLVKGPLYRREELQGKPNIEFVVTFTHTFPNSFPVVTVEPPPPGWKIKRHPNIDVNGCCYLASVTRWNPCSSHLMDCIKDLHAALQKEYPFEQGQPTGQQQQQLQQVQQNAPPPQVAALGGMIFQALRPAPVQPILVQQQRAPQSQPILQAQVVQPTSQFDYAKEEFQGMLLGASKRAGTIITTPQGFGIGPIACSQVTQPLFIQHPAPSPLPPCTDPTPTEQYRQTTEIQARQRQEKEAVEASKPKDAGAFGSAMKALSLGAVKLSNVASGAMVMVEDKVRQSTHEKDFSRFQAAFHTIAAKEQLITSYYTKVLVGDGTPRQGRIFLTSVGLHFSSKLDEPGNGGFLPPYQFSVGLSFVVSLVLGATSDDLKWIHVVCVDNSVRSFFDVDTDWSGKLGAYASVALKDTPQGRLYNWLDHTWRAATRVPHPQYRYYNTSGPIACPPPPPPPPPSQSEMDPCCICMASQKNAFFQPCGHVCCCMPCASKVRECPLCRAPVVQTFQAFL